MSSVLRKGDILNDRYSILRQLGRGSFGRTYLVEDINRFNEKCVIKEFAPKLNCIYSIAKAQELFEQEAAVLHRLESIHIPKFRELFRFDYQNKTRLFLAQDYVQGQTYYKILQKRSQVKRYFSQQEIKQLLRQIVPVLEYIHSLEVIHRDISPGNIMLRSHDKTAMLIDFGCIKDAANKAQFLINKPAKNKISLQGTILGKAGYAPPEQIISGVIYYHSDLYALAATCIVLLTGKKPQELFDADSFEWNLPKQVNVDKKLGSILNKMLDPKPHERFPTAAKAIEAIEDLDKVSTDISLTVKLAPINFQGVRNFRHLVPKIWFYLALLILTATTAIIVLQKNHNQVITPVATADSNTLDLPKNNFQLSQRFSQGEKILVSQATTPAKQLGVTEFAAGRYHKAASLFETSLLGHHNDPEALIYHHNARIGQQEAYAIAAPVPLGSNLNAAQELLRGVAQAQHEINQSGGINGIPLKVIIINDDDNPKIARQVATKLSNDPQVLGVVGHYASDVTLATAKIYESAQLTAISPISTSVKLSNFSPYVFRTVPSDYIAARALAEYMLEQSKQQNVAIFYNSQSNYSQSLKSEFATAVALGGGNIVQEFDLSQADFSAADSMQKCLEGGAEALMLAANSGTLDKALQVVQVNRQRLMLLGGDDVYAPKTLEVSGEKAENMVLAIPWHIQQHEDAKFVQNARQLWQGDVNWRTATAYDATKSLIAALSENPSRAGVQTALTDQNFFAPGASSRVHFAPSGDRMKGIQLVKVKQSAHLSSGYEFVPVTNK